MKVVIAPNSFKESLPSIEAAKEIGRGLLSSDPSLLLDICPIGDGGDGTLDALLYSANGEKKMLRATGPLGKRKDAKIGLFEGGKIAYIEMAEAAGLKWVPEEKRNPLLTTTYGVGELISQTLDLDVSKIIVGVGGSATVEGGIGALSALGVRFLDEFGAPVTPNGEGLLNLRNIDLTNLDQRLHKVKIEVATDVKNPLLGEHGAARTYGPQKGADEKTVKNLETGLENLARLLLEKTGRDISTLAGGGAAGGISATFVAAFDAEIKPGIDLILDLVKFDERIKDASFVITGEGKLDEQTLFGKGPIGVSEHSKNREIPVIALAGWIDVKERDIMREKGITFIYPILRRPSSLEEAIKSTKESLYFAGVELGYMFKELEKF